MLKERADSIKRQFDSEIETYDKEVREAIPFYDEMQTEVFKKAEISLKKQRVC